MAPGLRAVRSLLLAGLCAASLANARAQEHAAVLPDDPTAVLIRSWTASLDGAEVPGTGGVDIAARDFVRDFFEARRGRPAWLDGEAGTALEKAIAESWRHGLRADDFHAKDLERLRAAARSGDPADIARFEIVATDAAARYMHHLFQGKVDAEALDPDWNFDRPIVSGDPAVAISRMVEEGAFDRLLAELPLRHPQYLALQAALERYEAIARAGGWPEVPSSGTLRPGMRDARILPLRRRLIVTGDLAPGLAQDPFYDGPLEEAVRRFQIRHGLDPDGIIGEKTFTALNRPIRSRIDQLRLSLERARWILRGLAREFVLVNVAAARTYLVRDSDIVWRTRSIVGQRYRKTPIFRHEITFMEVNPTWTVPHSILIRDLLPRIRNDPGFLARGFYDVVRPDGTPVDPGSVDWSAPDPPIMLVQAPGPHNALGRIKFMFPNKHAVYLHDTNDRTLFDRADRALSSGCVRIEQPFEFADLLMEGSPDWSHERRDALLRLPHPTRVTLPEPMPVLITYYTAWVEDGVVMFREDIYERDQVLLAALEEPFTP